MNSRMTIFQSIDKIRLHWLLLVVCVDVLYGGINIFGKADSAPQILLRSILPLPFWYGSLVLSGGLLTLGYSVAGGMVGTGGWGALTVAALLTIVYGTAQSYGGPVLLGAFAVIHGMITYEVASGLDAHRERTQRGS